MSQGTELSDCEGARNEVVRTPNTPILDFQVLCQGISPTWIRPGNYHIARPIQTPQNQVPL